MEPFPNVNPTADWVIPTPELKLILNGADGCDLSVQDLFDDGRPEGMTATEFEASIVALHNELCRRVELIEKCRNLPPPTSKLLHFARQVKNDIIAVPNERCLLWDSNFDGVKMKRVAELESYLKKNLPPLRLDYVDGTEHSLAARQAMMLEKSPPRARTPLTPTSMRRNKHPLRKGLSPRPITTDQQRHQHTHGDGDDRDSDMLSLPNLWLPNDDNLNDGTFGEHGDLVISFEDPVMTSSHGIAGRGHILDGEDLLRHPMFGEHWSPPPELSEFRTEFALKLLEAAVSSARGEMAETPRELPKSARRRLDKRHVHVTATTYSLELGNLFPASLDTIPVVRSFTIEPSAAAPLPFYDEEEGVPCPPGTSRAVDFTALDLNDADFSLQRVPRDRSIHFGMYSTHNTMDRDKIRQQILDEYRRKTRLDALQEEEEEGGYVFTDGNVKRFEPLSGDNLAPPTTVPFPSFLPQTAAARLLTSQQGGDGRSKPRWVAPSNNAIVAPPMTEKDVVLKRMYNGKLAPPPAVQMSLARRNPHVLTPLERDCKQNNHHDQTADMGVGGSISLRLNSTCSEQHYLISHHIRSHSSMSGFANGKVHMKPPFNGGHSSLSIPGLHALNLNRRPSSVMESSAVASEALRTQKEGKKQIHIASYKKLRSVPHVKTK